MEQQLTVKQFFERDNVRKKFEELLGKRAPQYITSVLQVTTNNALLEKSDPISIYNAAATAATLDLPINNSLGFAWIVPYKGKAQFQLGYKGLIQLAQRTGQYTRINCIEVYESQFHSYNPLTETLDADFTQPPSGPVVGYCAYFKLVNGFEKLVFWTRLKTEAHAKRFSKTFSSGPWATDFDAMAKKTVLKATLNTWGPLSIEMQQAIVVDQAVINNDTATDVTYIDNEPDEVNKELERAEMMLDQCSNLAELEDMVKQFSDDIKDSLGQRINEMREIYVR